MIHFRQDPLINQHLEVTEGSFTHVYKGKEYTVTKDTVGNFDRQLLQSLATRLRRQYPPIPKPIRTKSKGPVKEYEKGEGTDNRVNNNITTEKLIEAELRRLATTEYMVEDRLHYPRVFRRLISQPHLAFEERKLVPETRVELFMYVDKSVGYNYQDNGFHNTMVEVAKKIKGITVFSAERLDFDGDYYFTHAARRIPQIGRAHV